MTTLACPLRLFDEQNTMYIHIPIQYLRHQVVWICFGLAFFPCGTVSHPACIRFSIRRGTCVAFDSFASSPVVIPFPQTAYVADETSNISLPNRGLPVQVVGNLADKSGENGKTKDARDRCRTHRCRKRTPTGKPQAPGQAMREE